MANQSNNIKEINEQYLQYDIKLPILQLLDELSEGEVKTSETTKSQTNENKEYNYQSKLNKKEKPIFDIPINSIKKEPYNNDNNEGTTQCCTGFQDKDKNKENSSQRKSNKTKPKPKFRIPIHSIRNEKQKEDDDEDTRNITDLIYEEEDSQINGNNISDEKKLDYIIFPKEEKKENKELSNRNYSSYENIKEDNNKNGQLKKSSNNKKEKFKNQKKNSKKEYYVRCNISNSNKINYIKPKYNIPTDKIVKEIKDKIKKKNEIKNDNLKKNNNSNFISSLNNGLSTKLNNHNNYNYYGTNKLLCLNNYNLYNTINNYQNIYNQSLSKIIEQKKLFQNLKELGLCYLTNTQNINNYLLKLYINNTINNNNFNNYFNNPFISFNNDIYNNYNNYYNYGNQNPLLYNYIPNNNNILNINDINQLKNINNEKYTITLKSKTDDPNIEKISKIQVTTSYIKDNQKIIQENEPKKEKNIKNLINIEDIKAGKELRTVVRLNPIPPNYSSFDVSKLLDKYLKIESGKNQRIYQALYTPLCKIIGKNLGYCFVMMAKPKYVIDFYNTFNGKIFGKKKCKKPCNVIWADKQGDDFLKNAEEDPTRKPIIFKDIKFD